MVLLIIIILAIIAGIVVPRFLPTKRTETWDEKKQEKIVEEKAIAWMNWLVRGPLCSNRTILLLSDQLCYCW